MSYRAGVIFVLLAGLLVAGGCAPGYFFRADTDYYLNLKAADIPGEIAYLEQRVKEIKAAGQEEKRPEIHYYLALLASHYNNPQPDYALALTALKRYAELSDQEGRRFEIRYLGELLQRLEESVTSRENCRRLTKEKARLTQNMDRLRVELETLKKENLEMVKTIEELKKLDIRLEEKKRIIR